MIDDFDNLIKLIHGCSPWHASVFRRAANENPSFQHFLRQNQPKITKNLNKANGSEGKLDRLAEVNAAKLLLDVDPSWKLAYDRKLPEQGTKPDYCVAVDSGSRFYVEVKRFRDSDATTRTDEMFSRVYRSLRDTNSSLGFAFWSNEVGLGPEFADLLEDCIEDVISEVLQYFDEANQTFAPGKSSSYQLRTCPELTITFERVREKDPTLPTSNFGCSPPILYSQNESFKITTALLKSAEQVPAGYPCLCIFQQDSITIDDPELSMVFAEVKRQIDDGDDAFAKSRKFRDVKQMQEVLQRVSAVLMIMGVELRYDTPVFCENPMASCKFDHKILKKITCSPQR